MKHAAWFVIAALAVAQAACSDGSGSGGSGGSGGGTAGTGGSGGTGASAGSGGGVNWQDCFGADGQQVQLTLHACSGATCEMVPHALDCCGNSMLVGIDASKKAQFEACEKAWAATLPACGCPSGPTQIQQPFGETVLDMSEAQVGCENFTASGGICLTTKK